MDIKTHVEFMLGVVRRYTQKQFDALAEPADWTYQPVSGANHPLWIMGHLALADNRFAWRFRPQGDRQPEGYADLFWIGSQPVGDLSVYPDVEEVKRYFSNRREHLLQVVDELSLEELNAPLAATSSGSPIEGAPSMASWLLYAANHEMSHAGQLSVCRRGLGQAPLR